MPKGRAKKKKERRAAPVGEWAHVADNDKIKRDLIPPDSASPDEDSESVCSSQDGCSSVLSDELGGGGGGGAPEEDVEEDLEFRIAELTDQLTEKR